MVFVGTNAPVSFFAYPGKKSYLAPKEANIIDLCSPDQDGLAALKALSDEAGTSQINNDLIQSGVIDIPTSGKIDQSSLGPLLASLMPEDAIVSDESATSGMLVTPHTWKAKPHDWLALTGGSIGQGLPLAVGAAIAKPDRPVITLHGDGGAMYTIQALWTQARENLNITNVIFANNSYEILKIELDRVGAIKTGERAESMLSLDNPKIDWAQLSKSLGVPSYMPSTVEEFTKVFSQSINEAGPSLIVINL
jgi:acetolactate synthase-1/2/3 large subunit